ncbi:MAG: hypothetical protein PHY47_00215 [Lachnospiraceae bacterium]|nr:hypothetical protein [Lachnospiraceae bacterium]
MAIETAGMVMDSLMLSKLEAPIGDIRQSMLNETAFNAQVFGVWKLMNGQTCAGTEYAAITGNTNVPDATTQGAFLRQAVSGRELGSYQDSDNKSHTHIQDPHTHTQNAHHHLEGLARQSGWGYSEFGTTPIGTSSNYMNNNPNTASVSKWAINTSQVVATNQNTTATNQNSGGTESRPKNLAVNFYIKVSHL